MAPTNILEKDPRIISKVNEFALFTLARQNGARRDKAYLLWAVTDDIGGGGMEIIIIILFAGDYTHRDVHPQETTAFNLRFPCH